MAKEKFERNKPHCNIGTIGHVDHGKKKEVSQFLLLTLSTKLIKDTMHTLIVRDMLIMLRT
jgi:translation elongation factor EF-Tu-like GTPase